MTTNPKADELDAIARRFHNDVVRPALDLVNKHIGSVKGSALQSLQTSQHSLDSAARIFGQNLAKHKDVRHAPIKKVNEKFDWLIKSIEHEATFCYTFGSALDHFAKRLEKDKTDFEKNFNQKMRIACLVLTDSSKIRESIEALKFMLDLVQVLNRDIHSEKAFGDVKLYFFTQRRFVQGVSHHIDEIKNEVDKLHAPSDQGKAILDKLKHSLDKLSIDLTNVTAQVTKISEDVRKYIEAKKSEDTMLKKLANALEKAYYILLRWGEHDNKEAKFRANGKGITENRNIKLELDQMIKILSKNYEDLQDLKSQLEAFKKTITDTKTEFNQIFPET